MALAELTPEHESRRARVVAEGAGLSAKELQVLFGYKKPSSIYLIFGGKQRLTLAQMKLLAATASGKGEWETVAAESLLLYLQGLIDLGGSGWVARESNPEPTVSPSVVLEFPQVAKLSVDNPARVA